MISLLPFFLALSTAEVVGMYSQCGGINWTGATECASPATCYSQNPYYYQCTTLTYVSESTGAAVTEATTVAETTSAIASSVPVEEDTTYTVSTVATSTIASAASVPTVESEPAPSPNTVSTSSVAEAAPTSEAETEQTTATTSSATLAVSTTLSSVIVSASDVLKDTSSASSSSVSAISGGWTGTAVTTRYWDCCKPSCAWSGKSSSVDSPVLTCDASGNVLTDFNIQSGCVGGTAYMCNDQSPWVVSDTLAYGFAAASIIGGTEDSMCCSCVKLTFTDQLVGKEMVVQITNTGTDLTDNHFDIALPGGGVGYYTDGCTSEFGSGYSWGDQYGGVSDEAACSSLPTALRDGCEFRFGDWFAGADNPGVSFEQVVCPAEIIAKSGCGRTDQ